MIVAEHLGNPDTAADIACVDCFIQFIFEAKIRPFNRKIRQWHRNIWQWHRKIRQWHRKIPDCFRKAPDTFQKNPDTFRNQISLRIFNLIILLWNFTIFSHHEINVESQQGLYSHRGLSFSSSFNLRLSWCFLLLSCLALVPPNNQRLHIKQKWCWNLRFSSKCFLACSLYRSELFAWFLMARSMHFCLFFWYTVLLCSLLVLYLDFLGNTLVWFYIWLFYSNLVFELLSILPLVSLVLLMCYNNNIKLVLYNNSQYLVLSPMLIDW